MKTGQYLWVFLLACGFFHSKAQAQQGTDTLYFDHRVEQAIANAGNLMISSHTFGDKIAQKMAIVDDIYTYVVSGNPSSPGNKTIIEKPAIYKAVLKVNSYYRKQVKSKTMVEALAIIQLNHVLDVAISVYSQPTKTLEEDLKRFKKPEELAAVFKRVVLR
ncbi:MAG: hypothetical protein U1C46_03780 [Bacteroidales bacterium]|nr:hypothetical protein [Bacteroidales bacterium]MDZ4203921.1 hypothetical protein [Bacteroidales bacterium]